MELAPVHNRLTHSLKVAQVGRSLVKQVHAQEGQIELLAEYGGLDELIVEAAALAHDLGHPPFGHTAEDVLAELVPGVGSTKLGFNGNGQSFRIAARLAVRKHDPRKPEVVGLDLTRASLAAILKYPWVQGDPETNPKKWGAYQAERRDFDWCRDDLNFLADRRCPEAALMDWADDITYAVHDLEDFFRAGLIPLDRLATDSRELERFLSWVGRSSSEKMTPDEVEKSLKISQITLAPPPGPFNGSRVDRAALRSLTSSLISRFVAGSTQFEYTGAGLTLAIRDDIRKEVDALQLLARYYVLERPSLVALRYGQMTIVRELFACFATAAADEKQRAILPALFRDEVERLGKDASDEAIKRIVADLIASLSEAQAIAMHQRLTGRTVGSAMDIHPA